MPISDDTHTDREDLRGKYLSTELRELCQTASWAQGLCTCGDSCATPYTTGRFRLNLDLRVLLRSA